jgi:hypothetical protein
MHLAMCSACSNYNKLSRQLDELFEKIGEEDLKSMELSDAKKKEILSVIKDFEA